MQKLIEELEELQGELKEKKVNKCEIYSRIVGYYRTYNQFNDGKAEEAKLRKNFTVGSVN